MSGTNEARHDLLMGARVEYVRIDGGLVYLDLSHKGCDDEACTVLVRAAETDWVYPAAVPSREEEKT